MRQRRRFLWLAAGLLFLNALALAQDGWLQRYGGAGSDRLAAVAVRTGGEPLAVGSTTSLGAGNRDGWLLDLNPDGTLRAERTFGGSADDALTDVAALPDGGVVAVGFTNSFGRGGQDLWALRLGSDGETLWQNVYVGSGNNSAEAVAVGAEGELLLAGSRLAGDGGNLDGWALRLGPDGELRWHATLGGAALDRFWSVAAMADGGLVLAGETWSFGDGLADAWVVRLDRQGNVLWQLAFGEAGVTDVARAIVVEPSGDLVVAGVKGGAGIGGEDAWLLALDPDGGVRWSVALGGPDAERVVALASTPGATLEDAWAGMGPTSARAQEAIAGQIVVAGTTDSFGAGNGDIWLLGLTPAGALRWQRAFGAPVARDEATDVAARPGGGWLVTAETAGRDGGADAWLLAPDAEGRLSSGSEISAGESRATLSQVVARGVATAAVMETPPLSVRPVEAESPGVPLSPDQVPILPRLDAPDTLPDNPLSPGLALPGAAGADTGDDWLPLASLALALGLIGGASFWLWRRR